VRLGPLEDPVDAPTVYLVERNGRQQEAIRDKLRKHGYRVLTAHTPQLAVDRFVALGFDALIVDISRTQEEGLDTLRRVLRVARAQEKICQCIVLLASDQSDVARRIQTESAFRDHVTVLYRPVRLLELLATVKSLVPRPEKTRRASAHHRQEEVAAFLE
jgi:DNA-binding response OmpR family regulator